MTTERDPRTRIVLSWLHEDAHEDAERVLLRALDEVDTTPQRGRSWPVRRFTDMNSFAKLAIAAAAVVVIAVAGIQFLPRSGTSGGQPTPSPTPIATPTPSPLTEGSLAAGRYALDYDGPPTSLEVPAGWTGQPPGVMTGAEGAEVSWGPSGPVRQVFSDACQGEILKPVDGTVQSLVDALDAQVGTDATVTAVTLAGLPATRVDLVRAAGLDLASCSEGADGPLKIWHHNESGYYALSPGARGIVHILEKDGDLVIFIGVTGPDASVSDLADLEAVIASTQFGS